MSSRSSVATLRTAIQLSLTYLLTYFRSLRQRTVHGCCRRARRPPCRRCCRPGPASTAATSTAHRRSSSPSLTDTPTSPGPLHSTQLDIPRSELIAKFHYTDTDTDTDMDTDFFVAKLRWVRAGPFRRKKVRVRVRVRVGPVSVSV